MSLGKRWANWFKSLVKICSQPTNDETLAVDHKKITCPTAVFWALHDAWMPKESGERLKKILLAQLDFNLLKEQGIGLKKTDQMKWLQ